MREARDSLLEWRIGVEVVIGVLVVLVFIGAKLHIDEKNYQKKLHDRLLREWGKPREAEYNVQRMEGIAAYYHSGEQMQDVDDITWNDLDMDRIYQQMNHTGSAMGQEYLYALLRRPELEEKPLEERERLIRFFTEREVERLKLQKKLAAIGKLGRFSVYRYLSHVEELREENSLIHILQLAALLVSLGLCFVWPSQLVLVAVVVAVVNMVSYYLRKAEMEHYYQLFAYIVKMVHFSKDVAGLDIPELEPYFERLRREAEQFDKFCRGSWLVVGGGDMDGSLADTLMDYVRLLTHIDIIKFQSMAREAIRLEKSLMTMYEVVGFLDSMLAVASYRAMMEAYCVPELRPAAAPDYILEADRLYHPLLSDPVKNSILAHRSVLLTGSNASGKSTFIKTVAVNAILAQTIHTVLADRYRADYFRILSSMALRDDILSSESYYMVEIKSLKRIVDQAMRQGAPVLCFIDEVLRGTNTVERIAASTEILKQLAEMNALCFAATHDIELTTLLEKQFDNYHFEEQVREEDVIFDYRLRQGKAMTRNAIRLLHMIGYAPEIVNRAEKRVQGFLQTGNWQM